MVTNEDLGVDDGAVGREDLVHLLLGHAGVELADIEVSVLDVRRGGPRIAHFEPLVLKWLALGPRTRRCG